MKLKHYSALFVLCIYLTAPFQTTVAGGISDSLEQTPEKKAETAFEMIWYYDTEG